jgi:hypothetical protein
MMKFGPTDEKDFPIIDDEKTERVWRAMYGVLNTEQPTLEETMYAFAALFNNIGNSLIKNGTIENKRSFIEGVGRFSADMSEAMDKPNVLPFEKPSR